jgi:hypothetical protein
MLAVRGLTGMSADGHTGRVVRVVVAQLVLTATGAPVAGPRQRGLC